MFSVHVETVDDVAVIQCEGRMVRSEDAFLLRDAIMSRRRARVVVVELSEVHTTGGGAVGMLVYLQRWALDHGIRLKLFNPSNTLRDRLERASMSAFDIASADEIIALLGRAEDARQGQRRSRHTQPLRPPQPLGGSEYDLR
jgi:anti-anti-sigma regulatory factor